MLYCSVAERGQTKETAGAEQVVDGESECDPDSAGDMPATLHNQHSYNNTVGGNILHSHTAVVTSSCKHSVSD